MTKQEIFIIGAGTMGKLVAEIIECSEEYFVAGFYDDNHPDIIESLGYAVIGSLQDLDTASPRNLAIGIGDPQSRKLIFEKTVSRRNIFPSLIHPSVVMSKHARIADGVIIGPNSSVLNGSKINKGACILSHVNINQNIIVGAYSLIGAGAIIGNNATLGEGCHISMGSRIQLNSEIEPWTYYTHGQ